MQIFWERTGGFAGIRKSLSIDTDNLPAKAAEELSQLVTAADFFHLPEQINSPSPQCDRFQYRLTVKENGKQHTVTISEAALSNTLSILIAWLNQAANSR